MGSLRISQHQCAGTHSESSTEALAVHIASAPVTATAAIVQASFSLERLSETQINRNNSSVPKCMDQFGPGIICVLNRAVVMTWLDQIWLDQLSSTITEPIAARRIR